MMINDGDYDDDDHGDYDQVCGVECAKGSRHRAECKLLAGQKEPTYAPVIIIIIIINDRNDHDNYQGDINHCIVMIVKWTFLANRLPGRRSPPILWCAFWIMMILPGHAFENAAAPRGQWGPLAEVGHQ